MGCFTSAFDKFPFINLYSKQEHLINKQLAETLVKNKASDSGKCRKPYVYLLTPDSCC